MRHKSLKPKCLGTFCQGKQPGVMGPGLALVALVALVREGIKGSSRRIQSASQFWEGIRQGFTHLQKCEIHIK